MSGPHSIWAPQGKLRVLNILPYSSPLSSFDLSIGAPKLIIACPDPPAAAVRAGHAISLPTGTFNGEILKRKLPKNFRPDLIHLAARDPSFLPRNLRSLGCPVVVKLGDTFQASDGSLSEAIAYCAKLEADFHWSYQCPHHLHFFAEAGLKGVFALPGTVALNADFLQRRPTAAYDIIFRGSIDPVHKRRKLLLERMLKDQLPLDVRRRPYRDCLEDYASAKVSFNCSANGDTNRRIFEVMMAGGTLLTDRLGPRSGLAAYFQEGIHYEAYGSFEELTEKAKNLLRHPTRSGEIASAAQHLIKNELHPDRIRGSFYEMVLRSAIKSEFSVRIQHAKVVAGLPPTIARAKAYEVIQDICAQNERIDIFVSPELVPTIAEDLQDFPRLVQVLDPGTAGLAISKLPPESPHLSELAHLLPGGSLLIKLGAPLGQFTKKFRKVRLGDSTTGQPLGHRLAHFYRRVPGEPAVSFTKFSRPKDLARQLRRLKAVLMRYRPGSFA